MKVFLAVTSFETAYGGPAHSVSSLATHLSNEGACVGVWAPDGSASASRLLRDPGLQVFDGTLSAALDAFGNAEVIHDSGIWLVHNHRLATAARRRGTLRIVSIRGMLDSWAMNHKRWKKRIAWNLYQKSDLRSAACLHATSDAETLNVHRLGMRMPIATIPNGVEPPQNALAGSEGNRSRRTALYLGRIHPKKGLSMLIKAWSRIRPRGWNLRIIGPDSGGCRAGLEDEAVSAGLADSVKFGGTVEGDAKESAFRNADLFIHPTFSENFGITVAEALVRRIPVITTKGAPWSDLTRERCGWWVDPTPGAIAEALAEACQLSTGELREMGARGEDYVRRTFSWKTMARRMLALYRWLVAGGPAPKELAVAGNPSG